MAGRVLALGYGVVCYLAFLASFLYAIGFVGNWVVPKSIDYNMPHSTDEGSSPDRFKSLIESIVNSSGATRRFLGVPSELIIDLIVNIGLLSLFALQHSGMARPGFKRWWTTLVPQSIERSTYVLFTSLVLALIFWQWRPIPDVVWKVDNETAAMALHAVGAIGWLVVLLSTFLLDHFSLFGLKQPYYYLTARELPSTSFRTPLFYRYVRHPLMLGFLIAFWSTPNMSLGRLIFSVMITGYILVAVQLEERDLVKAHGEDYRRYQQETSMLLPLPKKRPVS